MISKDNTESQQVLLSTVYFTSQLNLTQSLQKHFPLKKEIPQFTP